MLLGPVTQRLECHLVTVEVAGSNPVGVACSSLLSVLHLES